LPKFFRGEGFKRKNPKIKNKIKIKKSFYSFIYLFSSFGGVCCTPTRDVDFRDVGGPTTYTL
jgi:hypothetical protein